MIREAHAATAASIASWGASLAFANEILAAIASLVAIVAGGFAIAVYIRKLQEK